VETGSAGDKVIFEEFKGTSNAELRLDRKLADKRLFPAVDIDPSGTRMEEILLAPDERVVVTRLRKALSAMGSERALEQLLDQLKATGSNAEFLFRISRSAG